MKVHYLNRDGDFILENADEISTLYFPIGNDKGVMGSITPSLHGDSKMDQNTFFLEPVSSESLHTTAMARNMWITMNQKDIWAINGCSPMQQLNKYAQGNLKKDSVRVSAGKLWHLMERSNADLGVTAKVLSYAPIGYQAEVMKVTIINNSDSDKM